MIFVSLYTMTPDHRNSAENRFKQTAGRPPAGIKSDRTLAFGLRWARRDRLRGERCTSRRSVGTRLERCHSL